MPDIRLCSIEGCGKPTNHRRRWCDSHYGRWRYHGDPLGCAPVPETTKLFKSALLYAGDDCLLWPFSRMSNGYARISVKAKWFGCHRLICEAVNGPPPSPRHEAAHSCGGGSRGCVNPKHLRWATHIENEADKINNGTRLYGEAAPMAKLNQIQVAEIRELAGISSHRIIANRFGVSRSLITMIINRRIWKDCA